MKNIKLFQNNKAYKIFVSLVLAVFIIQPLLSPVSIALAEDEPAPEITDNSSGADGTDGAGTGDAEINTGDGLVLIEVTNVENQNEYNDGAGEEPEEILESSEESLEEPEEENLPEEPAETAGSEEPLEATTTPEIAEDLPEETASSTEPLPDLTIENENHATTTNDIAGDGNTGENGIDGNGGDSTINTGDLGMGAGTVNDINYNGTDTSCEDCEGSATSTEPKIIDVDNNNTASTTNDIGLAGNTGENTISSTTGTSTISTGDIGIINILINFVNHNFFGKGRQFFINIFNRVAQTFDLSGYGADEPTENNSSGCEDNNCSLNVNNDNNSNLENNIIIDANTGENVIASSSGGSIIKTGDINIANDVLNIANLNVTGDGWFFAVVNIFGELDGDIVLPGIGEDEPEVLEEPVENNPAIEGEEGDGAETLAREAAPALADAELTQTSEYIITNSNIANVVNNIDINANSGGNEISSSTGAFIDTGDVFAETHTFNLINYNIYGDTWKFARINIFGNWQGFIHGLPAGYNYFEDEFGITIYNDFFDDPALYSNYANLAVENTNNATTTNNIEINANSGDNAVLHSGDSAIMTGDINIVNSLFNFINSNFTGDNWEFSMINVFGEWQGNLAFGQPELWITESITSESPAGRGHLITYSFLFGNNGDGLATDVLLVDDFNEGLVRVAEAGGGEKGNGVMLLELGDLPPNSQGSFSYTVEVRDDIPYGDSTARNRVTITANETDRDISNNTSGGTVPLNGGSNPNVFQAAGINYNSDSGSGLPSLSVVKTNDAESAVRPGDKVNFQIIVRNTGGAPLLDVLGLDVMASEDGQSEINRDNYNLETVYEGEEIYIDYTIEIKENIKSGTYINEVIFEGYDEARGKYISAVASSKVKVENSDYKEDEDGAENYYPDVVVGRIAKKSFVNPGEEMEYKLIVTNNGGKTAEDVVLTENLPDPFTFDDGSIMKEWEIGDLEPGAIFNINYVLVKAAGTASAGVYKAVTEVSGANINKINIVSDLEVREVKAAGVEKVYEENGEKEQGNYAVDKEVNINKQEEDVPVLDSNFGVKTAEAAGEAAGENNGNTSSFNYLFILLIIVLAASIIILKETKKRFDHNNK